MYYCMYVCSIKDNCIKCHCDLHVLKIVDPILGILTDPGEQILSQLSQSSWKSASPKHLILAYQWKRPGGVTKSGNVRVCEARLLDPLPPPVHRFMKNLPPAVRNTVRRVSNYWIQYPYWSVLQTLGPMGSSDHHFKDPSCSEVPIFVHPSCS